VLEPVLAKNTQRGGKNRFATGLSLALMSLSNAHKNRAESTFTF
jgi:hypothetical protein